MYPLPKSLCFLKAFWAQQRRHRHSLLACHLVGNKEDTLSTEMGRCCPKKVISSAVAMKGSP